MRQQFSVIEPDRIRIVSQDVTAGGRPKGVIEIPIASETHGLIEDRTAGGGGGSFDLDHQFFDSLVENLGKLPGPVTVWFGHERPGNERKPKTPASGQILKLFTQGTDLIAQMKLGPEAWNLVVEEEGFFAFSIEADFNKQTPTGDIPGWTLTGGVFTNFPALDVNFAAGVSLSLTTALRGNRRSTMPKTLEELQAENTRLEAEKKADTAKVVALEADKKKLEDAEVVRVKAEADRVAAEKNGDLPAIKELRTEVDAGKKKNLELESRLLSRDVTETIQGALRAGVAPSFFDVVEGGADWKKDAPGFLAERFGGNLVALQTTCDRLPKQKGTEGVGSGSDTGGTGAPGTQNDSQKLDAEVKKAVVEKKIPYHEAMEVVRASQPELFKSGTAHMQLGRRQ